MCIEYRNFLHNLPHLRQVLAKSGKDFKIPEPQKFIVNSDKVEDKVKMEIERLTPLCNFIDIIALLEDHFTNG